MLPIRRTALTTKRCQQATNQPKGNNTASTESSDSFFLTPILLTI